ncbi:hypothetical protein Mp_3g06480 [Marchantia polymorpha subsp. ruderalis]|nr:hypothetical protein MARPO_0006s0117 [Marchantia polymorpha]BBN04651.1 hypothetical protein Mp_3g06480 [Marchantia polymorpha subsp. ruderalis]|eukprot:PTQ48086.1 hypothetical protein MARPO_0006s0117 [Marchantia polymorpha]
MEAEHAEEEDDEDDDDDDDDDDESRRDGEAGRDGAGGGGGGGGELEREDRLLAEMEEGGDTDYLMKWGRSMNFVQGRNMDDPTFLALSTRSDEVPSSSGGRPWRAKSARELEGEGVEAEAIRRGILEIEGVSTSVVTPTFRRRSMSFNIPLGDVFLRKPNAPLAYVRPAALISPAGSSSVHEPESAASAVDGGAPQVAAARGEEDVEILHELPRTDLRDEESGGAVAPEAAAPADESAGDYSGTPETLDNLSATPNSAIANAATRNKSFTMWHSDTGRTAADPAPAPTAAPTPAPTPAPAPAPEESAEGTEGDTVYRISSTPSASIAHAAKRSNSWSLWNSEGGRGPQGRRQSSPVAEHRPAPEAEIQRRSSWSPWSSSSGPTKPVQVVVKRSEAISPRQISDSPRRSQIASTTSRDVDVLPALGADVPPSAMAGAIMYTNTLYDLNPEEPPEEPSSHHSSPSPSPSRPREEPLSLMMDDETYARPTVENIYDRPPMHSEFREQNVERIFDVKFPTDDEDVDRIFDVPDVPDTQQQPHRDIQIDSVMPSPATSPVASHAGSKMPSRAASPSPSRAASRSASSRPSPTGTDTSSPAQTSGSSSTDTAKDSEQRRAKPGQNPSEKPKWRY